MSLICLITDFGTRDIYVGVMKGVMRGINPAAHFIDITHGIDPQNVRQAAFALLNAYNYFPIGTTFLVVVDPGVGSTRRPIIVEAGGYYFVAPDNGVLSYVLTALGGYQAYEISLSPETDSEISNTFHGRDVFAPVAARLSAGSAANTLGTPLDRILTMPMPQLIVDEQRIVGEVVHIDRFGNLITSIGHLRWASPERLTLTPAFGSDKSPVLVSADNAVITISGHKITSIKHTYSEAERGGLLALIGSSAYIEISVNQASAAQRLDATVGDPVELEVGNIDAAVSY